jgi:hypothetical protein
MGVVCSSKSLLLFIGLHDEQLNNYPDGSEENKTRNLSRCTRRMLVTNRILIIGDSHVRGYSEKLMNSIGKAYRVIWITKPNANVSAILHSINLKDDKLSQRNVLIFCGGYRDIAKNESTQGVRMISNFGRRLEYTNVIITTAPHRFDLQATSCVNREVEKFNRKLRKQLSLYDHIQLCNIPKDREHYTQHGLHMNLKGKTFLTNKWMSLILAMTTRTQKNVAIPLPWTEGNVNSVASLVNKKILSLKSTKVAERNHHEPTVQLVAKQNSSQVYKDHKKTDSDQLVPNEDSIVKIATSESTCSSLTGASDQNAGKAKPVDIEEDDIIKVIGKERHSDDKGGTVEGGYEEENKDKPRI